MPTLREERALVDKLLGEAGGAMVKVPKGDAAMSMISNESGSGLSPHLALGRLTAFVSDVLRVRQSVVVKNDNGMLSPSVAAQAAKMAASDLGMMADMASSSAPDPKAASVLAKGIEIKTNVMDDGVEFKLQTPIAKLKKWFGKAWPKPSIYMAEADESSASSLEEACGGKKKVRRKMREERSGLREEPESILGPGAQIPPDSDLAAMFKTVKAALGRFDTIVTIRPQIKFGGGSLLVAWSKVKAERQSVDYLNNDNAAFMVQGFDAQGMAVGGKVKGETLTVYPRELKIRAVSGEPGKVAQAIVKAFTTLATKSEKTEDVFESGATMVEASAAGGESDVWQNMLTMLSDDVRMGNGYTPTKGVMQNREATREFEIMKAIGRKIRADMWAERDGAGFMIGFQDNRDVAAHNAAVDALIKELNGAGFVAKRSKSAAMQTGVALVRPNAKLMQVVLDRYGDYLNELEKRGVKVRREN